MIANFSKNPKEVSISLDDYYPDDFEIYSEESSQDSPNQSLELVNISYTKNNDKNLEKVSLKIDLDFEKELDFLLNKQIESKTLPILRKNPQSNSDFYTPLLGRRFNGNATNIDDWIEQQTKDLKLSTEYRKSNPYCYFRDQREESPSTEFSYNANKFNYNNPRPTLCGKKYMNEFTITIKIFF